MRTSVSPPPSSSNQQRSDWTTSLAEHPGRWISGLLVLIAILVAGAQFFVTPVVLPTLRRQAPSSPLPNLSGVVNVRQTALGPVLVNQHGLTLYRFLLEKPTKAITSRIVCTGECARVWPPLLVAPGTKLTAGPGVHAKLSTLQRAGGGTQVMANGFPLYTFIGDSVPGNLTGQNFPSAQGTGGAGYQGVWFALSPHGRTILSPVPTTQSTIHNLAASAAG